METAPLKSFATWARTALIREVTARFAVVLAPASPERVEQPKVVDALEKAVNAAGGGDKGRTAVADRVAYTWFNRIIALRFMDANGYTGTGVVSPQAGVEGGQPEILAEAKRGNIDAAIVGTKTRETVTGLLNGTHRSEDPQGEAYALLLTDYCRHWNRAMPFMFEREGDFTELLIPADLLADDSVLNRAVKVLTADVCQDVEVIGWLYQFYISERKDEVFAGFRKNKRAGADEIPAATQLFTPHWIVRYLVENSLGRLWMLNRPSSRLVNQMEYYIASVDEETDFLKISSPEEFKVVDPACGSGHMLTYAFDLLYAIYEEEGYAPAEIPGLILTNNLYGVEIDPRAGTLAAFALTMKARARQRTFFNKQVEPNVCVLEPIHFTPQELDFLITNTGDLDAEKAFWNQFEHANVIGSLILPDADLVVRLASHLAEDVESDSDLLALDIIERAKRVVAQAFVLTPRYAVVVANPPYMGGGNMGPMLSAFAKDTFPTSKADLFAMFIERAQSLVVRHGMVAMITMQAWAFLSSYEKLRAAVVSKASLTTFAHLGTDAFDSIGGAVVSTAAFVLEEGGAQEKRGSYVRLTDGRNEREKEAALLASAKDPSHTSRYSVSAAALGAIPGRPFAYWVADRALKTIARLPQLAEIAKPRQGLATSDNNRFLKQWWEPSFGNIGLEMPDREAARESRRRWFPCQKGGSYRKWYGNHSIVVDWKNDGAEMAALATQLYGSPTKRLANMKFYFREGGTWSTISANSFAMRYSPTGFISETKGAICFSDDPDVLRSVIAYANSTAADYFLALSSPTLDFHEGPVGRLPFDPAPVPDVVHRTLRCVEIAREDWDSQEESWDFRSSPLVQAIRGPEVQLGEAFEILRARQKVLTAELRALEEENNRYFSGTYGLEGTVQVDVRTEEVTLNCNADFRFGSSPDASERQSAMQSAVVSDLVSYVVGCMFGRYSLDEPGLILADQGAVVRDYLAKVPAPTLTPDKDNVIPIVDGDWFEDDIVARFRKFLRVAFGEQHFEENLRFVTESLGVRNIRDYFVKSFYKDHVQRYKKRPIYWLFSSPKGSFNALIYMHRYTPSTVSTVLNEYLREFKAKLESSLRQQERLAAVSGTPRQQATAQREADRLRKVLLELDEYEHDVLYPLASQQLSIDLDDGVKTNYSKFGAALKKIPGIEASDE
jgi:hypothetical protein